MAKYIPFSLVFLTVVLASYMASKPKPKPALKKMVTLMTIYVVIWCSLCLYVYPKHVFIE
jgi:hypothetical protein